MKRESQSDDGLDNKRNRRDEECVRLLIPSKIAGAIIGKGGQHIQKMRTQYKATVSVDDCQGPERTVLITSDLDSVCSIVSEMLKYFEERDDEVDIRILIHQSLAGCVIGRGGAKIKEIRDKIGCRILKVFSNVAPQSTDRVVQCIGKPDHCIQAVREVVELTKETPTKGPIHNYDPVNYDECYADEYGGFGGGMNGGGGNFRGDRQSRMDRNRDRFDDRRRDDRSRSGNRRNDREYISPWAANNMNNVPAFGNTGSNFDGQGFGNNFGNSGSGFGSSSGFGGSGGGGGGGLGNNSFGGSNANGGGFGSGNFGNGGNCGFGSNTFGGGNSGVGNGMGLSGNSNLGGNNSRNLSGGAMNTNNAAGDNKNSTQVTIPKDLAGAIIGKAGARIRRIRNESGAYITIDEALPGSNDRIITISGNPKQIQMAQYLLQQSVHENRRKF